MKNLIFLGAGHANCLVLRSLKDQMKSISKNYKISLISDYPFAFYSGMIPSVISKFYKPEQASIDVRALANWAGIDCIIESARKVIPTENKILLWNGKEIQYDLLSVNVGSTTNTCGIEMINSDKTLIKTRPLIKLLKQLEDVEKIIGQAKESPNITIIGNGAAALELSFAFLERLSKLTKAKPKISIMYKNSIILPDECKAFQSKCNEALKHKGIIQLPDQEIFKIEEGKIYSRDKSGKIKETLSDLVVLATGAQANMLIKESDLLPKSKSGYLLVDEYLHCPKFPNIFGVGDCITIDKYEQMGNFPPKAGVYAVREAPILANNLLCMMKDDMKSMKRYEPQKDFLKLLALSDGTAIGTKFGLAFKGNWVWKMKDYIDTDFMKLFDFEIKELNKEKEEEHKQTYTTTIQERPKGATYSILQLKDESDNDFRPKMDILKEMADDKKYCEEIVSNFDQSSNDMSNDSS